MNDEEFARQLEEIGEDLPRTLQQAYNNVMFQLRDEILSGALTREGGERGWLSATNNLKNSLQLTVIDNTLGISMNDYGWYQNYGVKGLTNKTSQFGLDEVVATSFGVPVGYEFQFGTGNSARNNPPHYWGIHYPGITAKGFLDIERTINRFVDLVKQNLEL